MSDGQNLFIIAEVSEDSGTFDQEEVSILGKGLSTKYYNTIREVLRQQVEYLSEVLVKGKIFDSVEEIQKLVLTPVNQLALGLGLKPTLYI